MTPITCSGLSTVGRLTTAAAQQLMVRRPGRIEWVWTRAGNDAIADAAAGADLVIAPEEIAHSNEVLVDGTPIEELVQGEAGVNDCASCADLVGAPCACRTERVGDEEYKELPEPLIATAILNTAVRL